LALACKLLILLLETSVCELLLISDGALRMLKITIHDGPEALTFPVEGKLIGAWAKELEQCWKTNASVRDRQALIVDLTETLYIDEEGKRVLKKLFREGGFFRTARAMTSSVVDEITRKSSNPRHGILTQSVVLWLFVSTIKGVADAPASPPALLPQASLGVSDLFRRVNLAPVLDLTARPHWQASKRNRARNTSPRVDRSPGHSSVGRFAGTLRRASSKST
jgi:hypothetical protein